MTESPKPRNRGKTPIFAFRLRRELRDKLEAAAGLSGRNLSEEVTARVKRTFDDDVAIHRSFGDERNFRMMQIIYGAVDRAHDPDRPDATWLNDARLFNFALQTINAVLKEIRPHEAFQQNEALSYADFEAAQEISSDLWLQQFKLPMDSPRRIALSDLLARPKYHYQEFQRRLELKLVDPPQDFSNDIEAYTTWYFQLFDEVEREMKEEGKDPMLGDEPHG